MRVLISEHGREKQHDREKRSAAPRGPHGAQPGALAGPAHALRLRYDAGVSGTFLLAPASPGSVSVRGYDARQHSFSFVCAAFIKASCAMAFSMAGVYASPVSATPRAGRRVRPTAAAGVQLTSTFAGSSASFAFAEQRLHVATSRGQGRGTRSVTTCAAKSEGPHMLSSYRTLLG